MDIVGSRDLIRAYRSRIRRINHPLHRNTAITGWTIKNQRGSRCRDVRWLAGAHNQSAERVIRIFPDVAASCSRVRAVSPDLRSDGTDQRHRARGSRSGNGWSSLRLSYAYAIPEIVGTDFPALYTVKTVHPRLYGSIRAELNEGNLIAAVSAIDLHGIGIDFVGRSTDDHITQRRAGRGEVIQPAKRMNGSRKGEGN